ncbi:GspH/FimT family pseudopilin [Variovorax sp. YR216]|uniref:GspH/FimT family pseudopilin n=1 Tax=Variovorax sp. YR216 TaxID=1882828 RepID=UPI0008952D92|nr:GspH/FimT family pseudopilin [Variovorax sp. YR216]SEB12094.1 type IV fimbrial biogenesis protein FimT [Variovorax sp. YR216]
MRQRGFTLVELVVTVAVLAMILAVAAPNVASWIGNARIRNVADTLQNGIQIARGEAVRRNQNVSFWLVAPSNPSVLSNDCTLSSVSGSWVVSVNSPVGHCADGPSTTSSPMLVTGRAIGDAGGNVTVAAMQSDGTTPATTVTFDGFGRVTNTDSIRKIDVKGTGNSLNLQLVVSSAGLVRMCDPRISDNTDPRKC